MQTHANPIPVPAGEKAGEHRRTTALICAAHCCSHFFQFLLPPLFPLLKAHDGVSFAELGMLVTIFYAASGLAQIPAGFAADRIGAPAILVLGLLCLATSFGVLAVLPPFPVLVPVVALAGLGNSVFHPADYAILAGQIPDNRLGRAFSLHAVAGMAGYAAAPTIMLGLVAVLPLSVAILVPVGAACALALLVLSKLQTMQVPPIDGGAQDLSARSRIVCPAVLTAFAFFAFSALPWIGVASFMPSAVMAQQGTPLAVATLAVSAQLVASIPGTLLGGWLADRARSPVTLIATGLAVAAVAILAVSERPSAPAVFIGAFALAGWAEALTTPSRDLLLRRAAPPGASPLFIQATIWARRSPRSASGCSWTPMPLPG